MFILFQTSYLSFQHLLQRDCDTGPFENCKTTCQLGRGLRLNPALFERGFQCVLMTNIFLKFNSMPILTAYAKH